MTVMGAKLPRQRVWLKYPLASPEQAPAHSLEEIEPGRACLAVVAIHFNAKYQTAARRFRPHA